MFSTKFSRRRVMATIATAIVMAPVIQACAPAAPPTATPAPAPAKPAAPAPAATTAPAAAPTTAAAAAPTTAPAAPPTAVPAAQPTTAPPAAAKPVTQAKMQGEIIIGMWQIGSGLPSPVAQQALSDAYNKVQPNVKLVWEIQVGGDYITWLGTQLAAGNPRPDIVSVNYQSTYAKYVDFVSYRDDINPHTGNKWSDDFDFEFYLSGATKITFFATQQVQVPWFYNTELFDKAGVKEPPQTYDQWMDANENILTKTKVAPIAMHFNNLIQWAAEVYFDQYHRDWVEKTRALPGDWNYVPKKDDKFSYDANDPDLNKKVTFSMQRLLKGLKEGKLRYDDNEMTELMRNWKRLNPYLVKDFWVGVNRYALFLQGQAAMFPDLTSSFWTLGKDLGQMDEARRNALKLDASVKIQPFKYDIMQYPSISSSLVKGKARGVESIAGEYLGAIDKNAQQTEMDVDFMRFWMSKAGYQPWVDGYAKNDAWAPSGKPLIKRIEVPEKYAKVFNSAKSVGNAEAAPNGFITMYGGYGTLWQREGQELVKGVLDGTVPPEEFGKKYHALITDKYWGDILKKLALTDENIVNPQVEPKK